MEGAAGGLAEVARVIHLAVAPVFLLTAVATTLMMLTNRLARIVDRARALQTKDQPSRRSPESELQLLERRARLVYHAITFAVLAALFVCFLMTAAFLGGMLGFRTAETVAILFIAALFAYTGALACLLREVFLAIGAFELRLHPSPSRPSP